MTPLMTILLVVLHTVNVHCHLLDANSQLPVENARISVADTAGTILVDSLRQEVWSSGFRRAFDDVHYFGEAPASPGYRINISAKGYETQSFLATPASRRLDLGDIYLHRPRREKTLNEVTVTATKVKMIMKGDTLEYDATAFRLPEGSMLDALIAALPRAAINDNGQISVNGKFVSELLVNGRKFFRGNPQVALKNLPSYTVKNVQVYQQTPEQYVGIDNSARDRSDDPLVMDVNLKPAYINSWIANAEGGYGSSLRHWDDRWMGRIFAMRYDKYSYIALQASANNLNDQTKAGSKGQWSKPDNTSGLLTTKNARLEYNTDWHDQSYNGLNTYVEVERQQRLDTRSTYSEQFINGGNVFNRLSDNSDSESWATKWRGEVSRRKDTLGRIWFATGVSYSKGSTETTANSEQWTTAPVYYRTQVNSKRTRTFSTDWRMYLSVYAFGDNRMGVNGDGNYQNITDNGNLSDGIIYPDIPHQNLQQLQRNSMPSRTWYYYMKPYYWRTFGLGRRSTLNLELNYEVKQTFNSGRRRLEEINDNAYMTAPSADENGIWALNEANSYHTVRRSFENKLNIRMDFKMPNDFIIRLNIKPDYMKRSLRDMRAGMERTIDKATWLYDYSSIDIGKSKDWSSGYGLKANMHEIAPDMLQMLDVIDSSNPLFVTLGNPNLKKQTVIGVSAYVDNRLHEGKSNYSFSAGYVKYLNTLAIARTYDRTTGVMTSRPENINGNWQISGRFIYETTLLPGQRLTLSNNLSPIIGRSADFSSDSDTPVRSLVNNYKINDNFTAGWEIISGMRLSGKVDFSWTRMKSLSGLFSPFSFTNVNFGVGFQSPVVWGINIDTDLMAYCRRGYAEASMNSTDWIWNVQLSRTFGPGGRYIVKIVGFDLLQQLPTIRQTVNAQGRTESRYNSQPAYALLTLTYRLDIKKR